MNVKNNSFKLRLIIFKFRSCPFSDKSDTAVNAAESFYAYVYFITLWKSECKS